jgi:putative pyruvate formate lyase activating enzyme
MMLEYNVAMGLLTLPATCELCPRRCGANRAEGRRGVCGADDSLRVARAALHLWEEPPISGERGSGTIFFSTCPLHCAYCQNESLSSGRVGEAISVERLADICEELAEQGAHNINLVTPTQYVPQIICALEILRERKMKRAEVVACGGAARHEHAAALPVVYNTSGYETVATIRALKTYVDVYLTDFKYASAELAARYSNAPDYPRVALAALEAMVEQVGDYTLDDEGILRSGVIVRHLMLPGQLEDSKAVLRRVFDSVGNRVCYSLMNQYTPMPQVSATSLGELQVTVSDDEYDALVDFALDLGIANSFMQEGAAADEGFIPTFDLTGVHASARVS